MLVFSDKMTLEASASVTGSGCPVRSWEIGAEQGLKKTRAADLGRIPYVLASPLRCCKKTFTRSKARALCWGCQVPSCEVRSRSSSSPTLTRSKAHYNFLTSWLFNNLLLCLEVLARFSKQFWEWGNVTCRTPSGIWISDKQWIHF